MGIVHLCNNSKKAARKAHIFCLKACKASLLYPAFVLTHVEEGECAAFRPLWRVGFLIRVPLMKVRPGTFSCVLPLCLPLEASLVQRETERRVKLLRPVFNAAGEVAMFLNYSVTFLLFALYWKIHEKESERRDVRFGCFNFRQS
eukprot:1143389-Pelagomonas_calceolata.AAC.4